MMKYAVSTYLVERGGAPRWGYIQNGGNKSIVPWRGWNEAPYIGKSVVPPASTSFKYASTERNRLSVRDGPESMCQL